MAIRRSKRRVGAARLSRAARAVLDASTLCALATVDRSGRAYVSIAYFAWTRAFDLVWISEPRATHSRNIRANGSAAIAVYDSTQTWGQQDRGIQLFGVAREAEGAAADDAANVYAMRFADYRDAEMDAYRLYVFRPGRVKLFDESELGAGTFVTARVGRDGDMAWVRTDVYDSTS